MHVRRTGWTAGLTLGGVLSHGVARRELHLRHGGRSRHRHSTAEAAACGEAGRHASAHISTFAERTLTLHDHVAVPLVGLFEIVGRRSTEHPNVAHADLTLLQEVGGPTIEARLGLRIMLATPLPEELLDVGDVRASRDVLDRFVVDGDDGLADEGAPLSVAQR